MIAPRKYAVPSATLVTAPNINALLLFLGKIFPAAQLFCSALPEVLTDFSILLPFRNEGASLWMRSRRALSADGSSNSVCMGSGLAICYKLGEFTIIVWT